MRDDSYIAATRFGLGPRPDDDAALDAHPMQWLLAQIVRPELPPSLFSSLSSAQDNTRSFIEARIKAKESDDRTVMDEARKAQRGFFVEEIRLKLLHALSTKAPFYERLVDFWSNHFSVSIRKGATIGVAGAFEREAIRPHIVGRFSDLLLAVTRHQAMQVYLDNFQSIGPNSKAGLVSKRGLNENLAREILELHTLGVKGGYTQEDVTNFAKVLTGWGIGNERSGNSGGFVFYPQRHEPGPQVILGTAFADPGEAQGVAVLEFLAGHPATAHHLAFKLARHFIADDPPKTAVDHLAQVFRQTGGDLGAVYRALIALPDPWSLTRFKIKTSYDLVVSAGRLAGGEAVPGAWFLQSLKFLGDGPLSATSPAGLPDTAKELAGPDALLRRIEWAEGAAHRLFPKQDAIELAERAIGPILRPETRAVIKGASRDRAGLALLLASPEFQRR